MTQKLLLVLFTGFLFVLPIFSQENDSLLALKYFNTAEEYYKNYHTLKTEIKKDSTYEYFQLALPLLLKERLWGKYITAARQMAKYKYPSDKEGTIHFLENILDTLKKYDVKECGTVYIRLATLIKKDFPDLYIKYLEKLIEECTDEKSIISSLGLLAEYYISEDKKEVAFQYLNKYLNNQKIHGKELSAAYKRISDFYKSIDKYELALCYLDSAIIASDDISSRARFINDKGAIYSAIGNFEKALEYCEQSVKEQLRSENVIFRQLAKNYSNIGTMFYAKGDFIKSNEYLDQCISLLQGNNAKSNELLIPFNIKILNYIELEKYTDVFKYANLYKNILIENQLDSSYAFVLYGRIYYNLGVYDSSLHYFQLAESNKLNENIQNYIGEIFYKRGEYEKSRIYFNKFISRLATDSVKIKHPLVINTNKSIGNSYYDEAKYDSALLYFNRVLELAGIIIDSPPDADALNQVLQKDLTFIIFETFWSISETYHKIYKNSNEIGDLIKSHSYLMSATELLNNYKFYMESVQSKLFWTERTSHFFDDAIQSSLHLWDKIHDKKYLYDAFRIIELSKVDVLKGSINESSAIKLSDIPDSLTSIENKYSNKLNSLRFSKRTELQKKNPNPVRLNYFDNEIFNIQRDYSYLIKNFELEYPSYHRIKYETNTILLSSLQEKLSLHQSVLQYYLGKDKLHLLLIDKDSVYSISSEVDSNFFNDVRSFTSLLRRGNFLRKKQKSEFISNSFSLYKKLLQPAVEYLREKKELIIIPSGELLSVPFELLIKEPSIDLNFEKLQYAIKDFNISYEYSATLGFDPKYKNHIKGNDCFIGFAPSFPTNNSSSLLQQLPELFYNEEEVNQIAQLFRLHNMEAEVYSGNKATEDNFKKIKSCRYIHVATHSEADKNNPDLSALYFSGTMTDTLNDNILYSDEIFNLKLSADLVVLSSCETGAGRLINGEGILSLTRGFIYNGVPNLLFSLWKVSDRSTKSLMVEFYKEIIQGKNYKTALREAKLKMLSNELTSFPDKWGAFILIGN